MLRKLFSGGSAPQSAVSSIQPLGSVHAISDDVKSAAAAAKPACDDSSGFPLLVSRLEDFEGDKVLKVVNRSIAAAARLTAGQDKRSSWIPLIAEFRTSTIAPLQAILAEIPQLKVQYVFCDHRNSALAVKTRYDKKIDEIQSTTRYESSRLQRNRAKQQAAAIRFKEINDKVRFDISRLLTNDLADLLGDSLEKARVFYAIPTTRNRFPILMDAQLLVAKRLEADALELQKRIESFKSIAAQEKLKSATPDSDPKAPGQEQPEEHAHFSDDHQGAQNTNQMPPLLELAQPPEEMLEPSVSNIHIMPQHVLSEEHSVCPRKKHVYGTRTWNLHRHIKDSMATGLDVTECIQLPEEYQLEEWVAVHVIDFFNEISLLFGTISEFCTVDSCPQMTAGPCYTYLWADGKQQVAPLALPAPEYVSCLLNWVQDQLDDPQVFPSDGNYERNPKFLQAAGVIFKRLFRVYAHMYHNHLDSYVVLHAESHLNFCFKRFIFFVREFQMIDQKELNALRKLIQTLVNPSTQQLHA